jgi:hypothetical protein
MADSPPRRSPQSPDEFARRYPRITAHIIAESLGYATPGRAARIGLDGMNDRENHCEWVHACYYGNARACLRSSIRGRHRHKGYPPAAPDRSRRRSAHLMSGFPRPYPQLPDIPPHAQPPMIATYLPHCPTSHGSRSIRRMAS